MVENKPNNRDAQGSTGMLDVMKFLPPVSSAVFAGPRTELTQTRQYSLFISQEVDPREDYPNIIGSVLPYSQKYHVGIEEDHHEGFRKISIGSYVKTIDFPYSLSRLRGGGARKALIPTGIEQLREGRSIFGTSWDTDQYLPQEATHIDIFARQFPDVSHDFQHEIMAKYVALYTGVHMDEQIVTSLAAQNFIAEAEGIEMNRVFRGIDGENPSIEDRYSRFGSFDARLLYPLLVEYNLSSVTFSELQDRYPHRLSALHEGYVTLDRFHLESVPDEIVLNKDIVLFAEANTPGYVRVPALSSLYKTFQLRQAGFDVFLAEAEAPPGFVDTDYPVDSEYALMVRPTVQQ